MLLTESESHLGFQQLLALTLLPAAVLSQYLANTLRQNQLLSKYIILFFALIFVSKLPLGLVLYIENFSYSNNPFIRSAAIPALAILSISINLLWLLVQNIISLKYTGKLFNEVICLSIALVFCQFITCDSQFFIPILLLFFVFVLLFLTEKENHQKLDFYTEPKITFLLWPTIVSLVSLNGSLILIIYILLYLRRLAYLGVLIKIPKQKQDQYAFILLLSLFFLLASGLWEYLALFPAVFLLLATFTRSSLREWDFYLTSLSSLHLYLFYSFNFQSVLYVFMLYLGIYLSYSLLKSKQPLKVVRGLLSLVFLIYICSVHNIKAEANKLDYDMFNLLEFDLGWILSYKDKLLARSLPLMNQIEEQNLAKNWLYCNSFPNTVRQNQQILADIANSSLYKLDGPCLTKGVIETSAELLALQLARPYMVSQYIDLLRNLPSSINGGFLVLWEPVLKSELVRKKLLKEWLKNFKKSDVYIYNQFILITANIKYDISGLNGIEWVPSIQLEQLENILTKGPVRLKELRQALLMVKFTNRTNHNKEIGEFILDLYEEELDGLALKITKTALEKDSLNQKLLNLESVLTLNINEALALKIEEWCLGEDLANLSKQELRLLSLAWLRESFANCSPKQVYQSSYSKLALALKQKDLLKIPELLDDILNRLPKSYEVIWQQRALEALGRYRESSLLDKDIFTRSD